MVIEMVLAGGFLSTSSAAIFYDCRILSSCFGNITFEHCYREADAVAHQLARYSSINRIDCIWTMTPLAFLFSNHINDVILFISIKACRTAFPQNN
jgi:hypothetical protein